MKIDEFIDKLKKTLKSDEFTEQNEADIREWITDNLISEMHLNVILKHMKMYYKYRTFPRLANIVEIWEKYNKKNDNPDIPYRDPILEQYAHTGLDKIIAKVRDIKYRDPDQPTTNEEWDFLSRYDVLLYAYDLMISSDMDDEERGSYLRQMKETIQRGEKVNLSALQRFRTGKIAS